MKNTLLKRLIILFLSSTISSIYYCKGQDTNSDYRLSEQILSNIDNVIVKYTTPSAQFNHFFYNYRQQILQIMLLVRRPNEVKFDRAVSMWNNTGRIKPMPDTIRILVKHSFDTLVFGNRVVESMDTINQLIDYINAFYIEKTEKIVLGFNSNEPLITDWPSICATGYKEGERIFERCVKLESHIIFNSKFEEFYTFLEKLLEKLTEEKKYRTFLFFYHNDLSGADKIATSPNGLVQFNTYLVNSISFSDILKHITKNGGYIHITFIVEKDGSLTYKAYLFVKDGVHDGANKIWEEEFRRVLENAPRWNSAVLNGEKVREIKSISLKYPE